MPTIDKSSLVMCIQALETAIQYNKFFSKSETVEEGIFEETNYLYDATLRKLAKIYKEEFEKDPDMPPLSQLLKKKYTGINE